MPILGDHLQEMDRTYTPLEKKRREEMHLHTTRYGFFKVAKDATVFPICPTCTKEILGPCIIVNRVARHYNCG